MLLAKIIPYRASRTESAVNEKPRERAARLDRTGLGLNLLSAAAFCIVVSALLAAAWPVIRQSNIETGDFAANSLLIQDAKHLRLWVGNYSRIGFNHPGPAILYVLAAGEWLFFDVSRIAPSPFSGQIIAVVIWQAMWIVALFRIFSRILESGRAAIIAAVAFLFATVLLDHHFLTGMWFPHLYYLPFAVAVMSLSRLAAGSYDSLLSLSISGGFLFNGHGSFVAMLALMLTGAVVYHGSRHVIAGNRAIWDRANLQTSRGPLLAASAIQLVFWIPLVFMTIAHFPGPVAEYLAFGSEHRNHSLAQSIAFTIDYWQGGAAAVLGIVLLGLVFATGLASYRAFVAVIGVSTLALVLYARYGIDSLEWRYLGLFYCAAPALTIAVAAGHLARVAVRAAWKVTIAAALVMSATTFELASALPDYVQNYREPAVRRLFENLVEVPHEGRLVFELNKAGDFPNTWSTVLGLQAYALRHGVDLICIDQNWWVSHTRAARCAPSEVTFGTRMLVVAADAAPSPEAEVSSMVSDAGVDFFIVSFPDLVRRGEYDVANHAVAYRTYLLGPGWLPIVGQSAAMAGNKAMLSIPLRSPFTGSVELEVEDAQADGPMRTLTVYREKSAVARAIFEVGHRRHRIVLPAVDAGPGTLNLMLVSDAPPNAFTMSGPQSTNITLRAVRLVADPELARPVGRPPLR